MSSSFLYRYIPLVSWLNVSSLVATSTSSMNSATATTSSQSVDIPNHNTVPSVASSHHGEKALM